MTAFQNLSSEKLEVVDTDSPEMGQPDSRLGKKGLATREALFQASIAEMEKYGYDGATIRAICKRADVSVATFYLYFESKEGILAEMAHNAVSNIKKNLGNRLEGESAPEQLRIFAGVFSKEGVKAGVTMERVFINSRNKHIVNPDAPLIKILKSIVEQGIAEGTLHPDLDPLLLAQTVIAMLNGIGYMWALSDGEFDFEEHAAFAIDSLLQGICS